jgi:hypothetical protein
VPRRKPVIPRAPGAWRKDWRQDRQQRTRSCRQACHPQASQQPKGCREGQDRAAQRARFRAAPLARHIAYLGREGVTRDGSEAGLFNATSDSLDHDAFAERCEEDRHHFRFIVSPEDAGDMSDLRAFSRELMEDVARDLETSSTGWRSITGTPTIPISIFWCGAGPMTAAIW